MSRSTLRTAVPWLVGLAALVSLIGIAGSATAAPSDALVVDDDGTECPEAGFAQIQPALDAAAENATVHVCAGTYHESLNLTTPGVSLLASEDGEVVLDGATELDVGVWVTATRSTIEGFEIRDYQLLGVVAAASTDGFHPRWESWAVEEPEAIGFDDQLRDLEIAGNTIGFPGLTEPCEDHPFGECVALGPHAVYLHGSVNATNASIQNNTISTPDDGWSGAGIFVDATETEVVANHVTVHNGPRFNVGNVGIWMWGEASDRHSPAAAWEPRVQDCPMPPERASNPWCPGTVARHQLIEGNQKACKDSDPAAEALPFGAPESPLGPGSHPLDSVKGVACPLVTGTRETVGPAVGPRVNHVPLGEWRNNTIADNVVTSNRSYPDGPPFMYDQGGLDTDVGLLRGIRFGGWGSTVVNNTIQGVHFGLAAFSTLNATIEGNSINNTVEGLSVDAGSRNATLRDNSVTNATHWAFLTNRFVSGEGWDFGHDIDRSNTIDGDPIVYLENASDRVIDPDGDLGAVHVVNSENVTIRDVASIEKVRRGVKLINVTEVTVENVTVRDSLVGITAWRSTDVRIRDNTVTHQGENHTLPLPTGPHGILVSTGSRQVTVDANTVSGPTRVGVLIADPGTMVTDNQVHDTGLAIVNLVDRTLLRNNTATGSGFGYFGFSPEMPVDPLIKDLFAGRIEQVEPAGRYPEGGLVVGNTFHNNTVGMDLYFDRGAVLHDNRMHDNEYNLWARNVHDIDPTNTVDGKPVYYLVGANGATIDGRVPGVNPGYVGVVDSQGVTVQHLELSNNAQGVMIDESTGVQVRASTFSDVRNGISVFESRGLLIEDVTVENAGFTGIGLWRNIQGVRVHDASVHAEDLGFLALSSEDVTLRNSRVEVDGEPFALWNVGLIGTVNATIEDNRLPGSGHLVGVRDLANIQPRIVDNRMADGRFGVGSSLSTAPVIADNEVDNATFGIAAIEDGAATIRDNRVSETDFGLFSLGSEDARIQENIVTDGTAGLVSAFTVDEHIQANTIRDQERLGVTVLGNAPGLHVEQNTVTDSGNGTWIDATAAGAPYDPLVPNGVCADLFFNIEQCVPPGADDAEDPSASAPIVVANNSIRANADRGVFVGSRTNTSQLAIHNNTIADNGAWGIDARNASGVVDARNNYWGAADGPSSPDASNPLEDPFTGVLADGSGDTVSENASNPGVSNVRFDAWLTEAPDTSADDNEDDGPLDEGPGLPEGAGLAPPTSSQGPPADTGATPSAGIVAAEMPAEAGSWCVVEQGCPSPFADAEGASPGPRLAGLLAEWGPGLER